MRAIITGVCLGLLTGTAQSASLDPLPEPGLWQLTSHNAINEQDVDVGLDALKEALIANQPAEHQEMMRAIMSEGDGPGDTEIVCYSSEDLDIFTQPELMLADLKSVLPPGCSLSTPRWEGSSAYSYVGSCSSHPDHGFVGDISGRLRIHSHKSIEHWHNSIGITRIDMTEYGGPVIEQPTETRQTNKFTWLSRDCGSRSSFQSDEDDADLEWQPHPLDMLNDY